MHSIDNAKDSCKTMSALSDSKTETDPPRRVKSYVRREGRITGAQQRALTELWGRFGLETHSITFDQEKSFGRRAPLVLEIGFGDGESLAAMCAVNPGIDFLGIDVHRPGIGHLLLRAAALELANLRVVRADAVEVLERHLPDERLDRVQIFFPDPWPKARHRKRRLIQPPFVSLLVRKLKPAGQLHIATDCEHYAHCILEALSAIPELENTAADKACIQRPAYRPLTKFEQRGRYLGHGVWEILVKKRSKCLTTDHSSLNHTGELTILP